jgi:hypothetical protein
MRGCFPAVFRNAPNFQTHRRASPWAAGLLQGRCVDCDRCFSENSHGAYDRSGRMLVGATATCGSPPNMPSFAEAYNRMDADAMTQRLPGMGLGDVAYSKAP